METVLEVMEVEPTAPRKLKADIPPDIETICLKCLEKSPGARYPTARALAEELDRFLKGEPIQARPASAVRKAVNLVRRHPWALAAVQTLVVVALVFGIFYFFEETAFLRAQQENPTLTRKPGLRHKSLAFWKLIGDMIFLVGVFSLLAIQAQGAGLPFWKLFGKHRGPKLPLGRIISSFAFALGLIALASSVILLVTAIGAYVWEGESIRDPFWSIYMQVWLGFMTLTEVIRDYRLVHYGASSGRPS